MVKSGDWINKAASAAIPPYVRKQWPTEWDLARDSSKTSNSGIMPSFFPHPELQAVDPKQEFHCIHEYLLLPLEPQSQRHQ